MLSYQLVANVGEIFSYSLSLSNPRNKDVPFVYINSHFCEITGYEKKEVLGKNCSLFYGPETDNSVVRTIEGSVIQGNAVFGDLLLYDKGQNAFHLRKIMLPINLDGQTYCLGLHAQLPSNSLQFANTTHSREIKDKVNNQLMKTYNVALRQSRLGKNSAQEIAELIANIRSYIVSLPSCSSPITIIPPSS